MMTPPPPEACMNFDISNIPVIKAVLRPVTLCEINQCYLRSFFLRILLMVPNAGDVFSSRMPTQVTIEDAIFLANRCLVSSMQSILAQIFVHHSISRQKASQYWLIVPILIFFIPLLLLFCFCLRRDDLLFLPICLRMRDRLDWYLLVVPGIVRREDATYYNDNESHLSWLEKIICLFLIDEKRLLFDCIIQMRHPPED